MNKRQRKKVWKRQMAPLHLAWFGSPLPRRVSHVVIARLSAQARRIRMQVLVDAVFAPTPLLSRLMMPRADTPHAWFNGVWCVSPPEAPPEADTPAYRYRLVGGAGPEEGADAR